MDTCGIHDLPALADGDLTHRGSPEAGPRLRLARPPAPKTARAPRDSRRPWPTNGSRPVVRLLEVLRQLLPLPTRGEAYIVVVVITACPEGFLNVL